ncbi:hypothetical protein NKI25_08055 [Mesorhizobium sp. M0808]|uniref:hypothetical protein n=1 Tax=Mesorhizobium sp. M0808 TaxID=2957002 RepID=UPI00333E08D3
MNTSNVWNLKRVDLDRISSIIWRIALLLFGLKFILDIVASVLFIYTLGVPGMDAHKGTVLGAVLGELSTAVTMLLQLLAWRFALEVGLRLAGEAKRSEVGTS